MKSGPAIIILGTALFAANGTIANAAGGQSYGNSNPDRRLYVNGSCCSWKTSHKAQAKAVKH
jgi:hypothetical protein